MALNRSPPSERSGRRSEARSHRSPERGPRDEHDRERGRSGGVTRSRSVAVRSRKRDRTVTPASRRHSRGSDSKRHRQSLRHSPEGRHRDRGVDERRQHCDDRSTSHLLPKHRQLRRLLRSSVIDTTNENLLAENRVLKKVC